MSSSTTPHATKIFISIAAYEDPSLLRTMRSAIDNAENPDSIYFGVGLQYFDEPDLSEFKNLKTISWHPDNRPGIVRIRYEISKLFENQDYYLQIDSHYDFAKGWDTVLVNAIKKIQQEEDTYRVFLFPIDGHNGTVMTSRWVINRNQESDELDFHVVPENGRMASPPPGTILPIPYMRVGQLFFDGRYISEVGLDEWSQLGYEQLYLGFKSFISGWKTFAIYESNILNQNDHEYQKIKDSFGNSKLGGPLACDKKTTYYEFSLALLFNDYSKYAVKNPKLAPEDFWKMQGDDQHKIFLELMKAATSYLHNN